MAADDAVSGLLAGQQFQLNKQSMQLNQLSLDEGQLKVQSETFKLQSLKNLADIQQKAFAAALKGEAASRDTTSSGTTFSQLRVAHDAALNEIGMGAVDDGIEKLKGIQAIEENQAKIVATNQKQADERVEKLSRAFAGINDDDPPQVAQAKFDQNIMFQQGVMGEQYDPKALEGIKQKIGDKNLRNQMMSQAKSAKQKTEDDKLAYEAEAAKLDPAWKQSQIDLNKAREAREKALKIKDEKNGNTPVKGAYITAAVAEIQKRHPGEKAYQETETVRGLALPIAEEVQDLMRQPGMTETKALAKAYDDHKDEIHLRSGRPTKGTTRYNPMPVPKLGSGRINQVELRNGIYYEGLGQWNEDTETFD
jgi:hypothetical protein